MTATSFLHSKSLKFLFAGVLVFAMFFSIFQNASLSWRSFTPGESFWNDVRIRNAENAYKHNGTDPFKKVAAELYVYSAFYDDVTDPKKELIRIIAIDLTKRVWDPPLLCHLYNENYDYVDTAPAIKVRSGDIRVKNVIALVFFLCEIPKYAYKNRTTPTYIRLKLPGNETAESLVVEKSQKDLMNIQYENPFKYRVAMCVQPLKFPDVRHPLFLLEWLEYQFLLDVDHITFYNYNSSKEVLSLLEIYEAEGKVTVKDWPVPLPNVHGNTGAQWVALSDCSHGYRGIAKYVIVVDTDEFIVPSENHDKYFPYLHELWKQKEKKLNQEVSFMLFPSKFAFDTFSAGYYAVDLKDSRLNKIANKLQIPTRTAAIPGRQKKFVMRPELILESGVHWPAATTKESTPVQLNDKEGFYLHFKRCDPQFKIRGHTLVTNASCLETAKVVQEVSGARRFGNALVERVIGKIKGNEVLRKMFLESGDW